jgi:hypothetical protein
MISGDTEIEYSQAFVCLIWFWGGSGTGIETRLGYLNKGIADEDANSLEKVNYIRAYTREENN